MWVSSERVVCVLGSGVHAHSGGNWPGSVHLVASVQQYLLGAPRGARYTSDQLYERYGELNKHDLEYA